MNNLSKLLDNGTIQIKKVNFNQSSKKTAKNLKQYFKQPKYKKKSFRNKDKSKSPKIIIKKQQADPVIKTNKKKKVNKVVPQKKINRSIDSILNKPEKPEKPETLEKPEKPLTPKTKIKSKKKPRSLRKKKSKSKKKIKTSDMVKELNNKGLYVTGKNKRLIHDMYKYMMNDEIRIKIS